MLHQLKQAFTNPKFLVGFVLFMLMLLISLIYPSLSAFEPLDMVTTGFTAPGTYVSIADVANSNGIGMNVDASAGRLANVLKDEDREKMKDWMVRFGGVAEGDIDLSDTEALLEKWQATYDPAVPQKGLRNADKQAFVRLDKDIKAATNSDGLILAAKGEDGLEEVKTIAGNTYVRTGDVVSKIVMPLGADNFGADVMTKLTSSIAVSLRIGLLAGVIATLIGLTIGLLSGFLGGWVDNFLTFLTNIFTVIPSFVILILIANAISGTARSPMLVGLIIGLTAWPWTARSVRSQVLSLRNRDHVSLSKLSGHSLPRIILQDILPYVASYVVMALILQISSGILAEAQLSMLGLGPDTTTTVTLGIMMNWAQKFSAVLGGAWWAFVPVVISVAIITFSLNLMNTGLDQVFNPQLRD